MYVSWDSKDIVGMILFVGILLKRYSTGNDCMVSKLKKPVQAFFIPV